MNIICNSKTRKSELDQSPRYALKIGLAQYMCVCTTVLAEQQNLTTDNKLPHTAVLLKQLLNTVFLFYSTAAQWRIPISRLARPTMVLQHTFKGFLPRVTCMYVYNIK